MSAKREPTTVVYDRRRMEWVCAACGGVIFTPDAYRACPYCVRPFGIGRVRRPAPVFMASELAARKKP